MPAATTAILSGITAIGSIAGAASAIEGQKEAKRAREDQAKEIERQRVEQEKRIADEKKQLAAQKLRERKSKEAGQAREMGVQRQEAARAASAAGRDTLLTEGLGGATSAAGPEVEKGKKLGASSGKGLLGL